MTDPVLDEPAPIEPTSGAGTMPLDPDQSGVSQDPTPDLDGDEAELASLLAAAGGVTAHQVLSWEASQIGTGEHPPGSNHTTYSLWGDGPWCFYFQSFAFRHFGALDLIHGAHGYVPDFKAIFKAHGEFHTSNPKAGDLVAFDFNGSGDPEHIGIVEKVISSSVIQTIEGNTSDKVMRRQRSRSYVYGYATPKYGTTPTSQQEDDMPEYVSLSMTDPQKVTKGQAARLFFNHENSDAGKAHADGNFPGILSGDKNGTLFTIEVKTTGGPGKFRLIEVDPAKKNYPISKGDYATHPLGESHTYVGICDAGKHLYVEATPSADGEVNATVKAHYWHR